MADLHELLRQAELDGERVAALFRLIIFASLLSVVAFTDQGLHRLDISAWLLLYASVRWWVSVSRGKGSSTPPFPICSSPSTS